MAGINAEWLLGQIESEKGWFRFPPYFSNLITNLKIYIYPLLYLNENSIGAMMFRGFLSEEELREMDDESIEEGETSLFLYSNPAWRGRLRLLRFLKHQKAQAEARRDLML